MVQPNGDPAMPMNRRELVTAGAMLGGAALMTTKTEGQAPEAQPAQIPQPEKAPPEKARGKVAVYGEGNATYFALTEMPKGIKHFYIDERAADRIGRLVLAAAEKGWELQVRYIQSVTEFSRVYDVWVENFRPV